MVLRTELDRLLSGIKEGIITVWVRDYGILTAGFALHLALLPALLLIVINRAAIGPFVPEYLLIALNHGIEKPLPSTLSRGFEMRCISRYFSRMLYFFWSRKLR